MLWCVVVCCVGSVMCLFLFFSQFSSFSFLLSLFLSSFFFLSSLFFPLFSLHFSPRRPTSRHLNVTWRTASAQQLLPPPFSPSPPQKKRGNFLLQEYFRRGIFFFYYSLCSFRKNRRRVKLQILQFYINSKKFKLQRVNSVIIFGRKVLVRSGLVAVDTAVGAIVVSDLSFGAGRPALCLE